MPSASILELTSDQTVTAGSTTTIPIDWDTETKYLDAAYTFYSGANPDRLTIPAAMDGSLYEVFVWVEDAAGTWEDTSNGMYIGVQSSSIPETWNWWGIQRDVGKLSRGIRTGLLTADNAAGYFYSNVREFGSASGVASASKCRFGVLEGNPDPVAQAAAHDWDYTVPGSSTHTMRLTERYDVGEVYRGGVYTVPPGAELAVVNAGGYIISENNTSVDFSWRLTVDGTETAQFRHDGSGRGFGPGTFGMLAVTPGEELEIKCITSTSLQRSGRYHHSVEFY